MAQKPTPVEKPTTKTVVKAGQVTKNPNSVRFERAPFYNLSTIRKGLLTIITRTAGDPAKVEAIRETLNVALAFLAVRSEYETASRAARVASDEAHAAAAAKAAAEHDINEAQGNLRDSKAGVSKWAKVLKELAGE